MLFMTILAIIIQLLAFYMLYNTSARAELRTDAFSLWLQQNRIVSKITGLVLLIGSFILLTLAQGLGSGILYGTVLLMTLASLIVLFAPLKSKEHWYASEHKVSDDIAVATVCKNISWNPRWLYGVDDASHGVGVLAWQGNGSCYYGVFRIHRVGGVHGTRIPEQEWMESLVVIPRLESTVFIIHLFRTILTP